MTFSIIPATTTLTLLTALTSLLLLVVLRFIALLPYSTRPQPPPRQSSHPRKAPCKICIILGSGGHTSEMLRMLDTLPTERYSPRCYVVAESDTGSGDKAVAYEKARADDTGITNNIIVPAYTIHKIPRARSVHQSYLTTPLSFLRAAYASAQLLFTLRPDIMISNGPGTALPMLLLAFLTRILPLPERIWRPPRLLYVESWARVKRLSMTGRICWWFVDRFLVQWEMPGMKGVEFVGRVV
ncbi:oligosaccharide biosynthesis protein Alg14 like-domain-containing protein [Fimicolochytrium jonesii]|uniref:oligosaccharide biosynthesis protein Alg14 like-domain-containing protein n=1 Tax=Fimicolochytrium jonesii TaxID=1396493 RepID=UPI0022FE6C28|nr:oligosaccharide biosynthesis protein Alg14 like-domain-containing protein [Fimicolochytrium jonesii]KAI8821516.1 oligosaccharide biosynthesis protein Alg14 like-domain-containing protein [Fimicolochytrium jonesii]